MMYIQLSLPYRDFDKISIKAFHVYENAIGVTYNCHNNNDLLFEKTFHINNDQVEYTPIMTAMPVGNFSVIENVHKLLLEYMITNNIETGTLEVE